MADDRDPMDEPGVGVCGHCGSYPIAEGEDHECDEGDPMDEPGVGVCGHCGSYPIAEGEDHECVPAPAPGPGVRAQHAHWAAAMHRVGEQYPGLADRISAYAGPLLANGWAEDEVLVWFAAPTGWLGGRVPADVLDTDPDAVVEAVAQVSRGPW